MAEGLTVFRGPGVAIGLANSETGRQLPTLQGRRDDGSGLACGRLEAATPFPSAAQAETGHLQPCVALARQVAAAS